MVKKTVAPSSWTLPFFASTFGQRQVAFGFPEDPAFKRLVTPQATVPIGRYIRKVMRSSSADDDRPYLRNLWLLETFPELASSVQLPAALLEQNVLAHASLAPSLPREWNPWIELFLSPEGALYPEVHVDAHQSHAWLAQISGVKEIIAWQPRVERKGARWTATEIEQRVQDGRIQFLVDGNTSFEDLFDHTRPIRLRLEPGEMAVIPAGWWHTALSVSASVTLSGNFVSPDVAELFFLSIGESSSDEGKFHISKSVQQALLLDFDDVTRG